MKLFSRIVLCLFVIAAIIGCASSTITSRHEYKGGKIARPDHIIVYDFTAAPADVPAEQIATGRQVGAEIAKVLVADIRAMGLPAVRASSRTAPRVGDLVIKGNILSINQGSAAERVAIGFGSGAVQLKATAAGYLMTKSGLRKLGSGTADTSGSQSPGAALGVAGAIATGNPAGLIISTGMKVYGEESGSSTIEGRAKDMAKEIAGVLQVKFREQGWIQ
jgi:Domain of unknown function (DUF4410)